MASSTTMSSNTNINISNNENINNNNNNDNNNNNVPPVFDSSFLEKLVQVPAGFIWPEEEQPRKGPVEELNEPLIDLAGFLRGDEEATRVAVRQVAEAGRSHGFFQVVNHGVDAGLMARAMELVETFFRLPVGEKLRAKKPPNGLWGYSAAHGERFSVRLPWKETLSFGFPEETGGASSVVVDYFQETLGKDFEEYGIVYQKYGEAMLRLCHNLLELLAISLGVDRLQYKEFFEDSRSIMRCNFYPPCPQPDLAIGTGAHCDPTSLTVLFQDHVGGLQVFHNENWYSVSPVEGALVINIGDTFKALTNGIYKSCLHRAVVNKESERKSIAFFLNPKEDKAVKPPNSLVSEVGSRKYPDFTWSDMAQFTKQHYRADPDTLKNLINWLYLNSPSEISTKSI